MSKRTFWLVSFGLALALAFPLLTSCTPEQNKATGQTLTTTGQVLKTVEQVVKEVPVPGSPLLAQVLGGLAAVTTAAGAYFGKKAIARKAKEKVLRKNMTKAQRVAADKAIYGRRFKASLSK